MPRRRIPEVGMMLRFYDGGPIFWHWVSHNKLGPMQRPTQFPFEAYICRKLSNRYELEDMTGKRFFVYYRDVTPGHVYIAVEPGVGDIRREAVR